MKKALLSLLVCLIMVTLASCGQKTTAVPTAIQTVVIPPTETATVMPTATPTQPPAETRTRYELTAVLNYQLRQLEVDEAVTYTNRASAPLSELVFVVEPNLIYQAFSLNSLTWDDGSTVNGMTLTDQKMTVPLKEPLQPYSSIKVKLSYTLNLPSTAGVLSFSESQVNLAGWYPYVAPYTDSDGWIVNVPGVVGEYQMYELADFVVNIRVNGAPAEFLVAASSKATIDGEWFRFEQLDARNFTWSGSSNYDMLEAYAGDIRVRAFVFRWDHVAGQASLDATVQALELYASLYGPYDQDSLTIVEASFPDGMEYDGLYFLGKEYFNTYEGKPSSYLEAISVHETAHQWWFGMVENDQANDPWLDETFCIYSELLFYKYQYPTLVNWWWQTRVDAFDPQGWVDSTIYDYSSTRLYVNAVYLRGARFFGQLNTQMGDDAFVAFLHDYFTQLRARAEVDHQGFATSSDFWRVLGEHTNIDLTTLKQQYFAQP
jgi:hypothetical protein